MFAEGYQLNKARADTMGMRWSVSDVLRNERSFLRSALPLVSGTVASQAILFLFSPLLSRVFGPADFGDLANYNAWVAILAMLSNLRYEQAMFVVSGRAAMNRVMALAICLSGVAFVLYTLIAAAVYLAKPQTGYLAHIHGIVGFIPLGTLPAVLASALIQFNIRKGGFKTVASVSVFQVIATLVAQLLLGLLGVANGLVLGALFGSAMGCAVFFVTHFRRNSLRHVRREMTFARLREAAREHANFPKYTLASDTIVIVIQQFVPVLLTGMFGPAIAGLYSFSARVVRVPLIVVATSVANVLRREAIEQLERTGSVLAICRRTVGGLSLIAIGPFALLFLFATPIFTSVFGDKWSGAGAVVRILAPGLLLEFIAFPLFVVFLVTQSQRYAFRIQVASIALFFTSLFAGRYYWNSFLATCVLMSFAMVLTNGSTVVAAFAASKPPRSVALQGVGAVP